jgi:transcriptional regulator GlxA family with amidase domain
MMQTMAYVEQCMAIGGNINPMLCLDDLIRRLIVMLLVPDLLEAATTEPLISEPFTHQGLVEWLLAHLHEPISLSDMEKRSCYSRRSLQNAFKQRFGCGPMQWLRQQRLAKAKSLLEDPAHRLSQLEVAQACGYLCQASFSRDFLNRFGERPSRYQRRFRDRSLLERLGQA